jgi:hypothetical protein
MHQHMMGPFWGNVAIIAAAGAITLACFAAMFRMLFRPGESDLKHPKRMIFGDERRTGG